MRKLRYGISPWPQRSARAAADNYPPLRGDLDAPVAIVGGGLTGTTAAYLFAAAGIRVVLLEAGQLGMSATARSAGIVLADPAGAFLAHETAHGRRAARLLWQATRRSALDMAAAIRRLNVRCGLESADGVLVARQAEHVRGLQREAQARRAAGLDASWLTPRALAALRIDGAAGIRSRGHARLDPYRACLGFARAAANRGTAIFERSAAERIVPHAKHVDVFTAGGVVRCAQVVLATAEPPTRFSALRRHFVSGDTYLVLTPPLGAAVRKTAPPTSTIVRDHAEPQHSLVWTPDDRILWGGADGPRSPARARDKVLVQRGGQLMYELSLLVPAISGIQPEFVWDAPATRTVDGLPFIGPHRNYPRHLFAMGLGSSLTGAFLAARVLLRHYEGRPDKGDEHFGFSRFAR
jgi:glycine/D-amino acid oxidase-like deaminating enzyme